MRFNADGSLDTAFGTNGKLRISNPANKEYSASDLAILPDGKSLLIGTVYDESGYEKKCFFEPS